VRTNGAFTDIGIGNHTVEIILSSTSSASTIRATFEKVNNLLTKSEKNELIFQLLYEMMRQNPLLDWFMKTSYISVQTTSTLDNSGYVKPNENEAILANILESKPYRTKLRNSVLTYASNTEDVLVSIEELPQQKITLLVDRLNCSLEDEAGWDVFAWDTEAKGWDKPFWDWSDQGLTEWVSLGTQTGTGASTYTFTTLVDGPSYNYQVIIRHNGVVIDIANIGVTETTIVNHKTIDVIFSSALDLNYTVEVQQSSGFYHGNTPTLGADELNHGFLPVASSFKHHVARLIDAGNYAPFTGIDACVNGQTPDQRIVSTVEDSMVICVTNQYTPLYAGWDATPWDSAPFDKTVNDIGDRVFFITAGNETVIPAGIQLFPTSEYITAVDNRFVTRVEPYPIAGVAVNGIPVTAGVDYNLISAMPQTIDFTPKSNITYTADGITTSFDASAAINGINTVTLNGVNQVAGIDYNMVGTNIVFTQPAPSIVTNYATMHNRVYISAGETAYSSNHAGNSLNVENGFVFNNGILLEPTNYTTDAAGNVVPVIPPLAGDKVNVFMSGNTLSNSNANFFSTNFVGDGGTTSYVVNNSADVSTSWVFVNGVYQTLGTDYNINSIGTIDFVVAPPVAAAIHIRVIIPDPYASFNQDHIVLTASGTPSDNITGITDANPDMMLIFVDGVLQDGHTASNDYTLSNGNPDVINWNTVPAAGADITIRIIRNIAIGTTTQINVTPIIGTEVIMTQNSSLSLGDIVTVYYTDFQVGGFNGLTINSVPTTYDIINGILKMDSTVLNQFVNVTYSNDRKGKNPTSILVRMTNVVDRMESNHLMYDGLLGSEVNRAIGLRVLNSTDGRIYTWDGSNWVDAAITLVPTDQVLVLQGQKIVEYDGATFNTVFNTGDTYSIPPVLTYPAFGSGILSGTYALGQLPNASTDFPEAYQINQHLGGC